MKTYPFRPATETDTVPDFTSSDGLHMAHVILRSGASLRGVKKVSVIRPNQTGRHRVQVLFRKGHDDDAMEDLFGDDIRIKIIRPNTGVIRSGEIDESGPHRRHQTKALRPMERIVRKMARRELGIAQVYLARHQRSNRLKKNGWLKDLTKNIRRAIRDSK